MSMPLRSGRHRILEEQADRLIRESLKGVTKHSEKADILTPWKQQERWRREVYTAEGVADPQIRRGMFHRAANPGRPELNSRDGATRPRSHSSSIATHVQEYGLDSHSDG